MAANLITRYETGPTADPLQQLFDDPDPQASAQRRLEHNEPRRVVYVRRIVKIVTGLLVAGSALGTWQATQGNTDPLQVLPIVLVLIGGTLWVANPRWPPTMRGDGNYPPAQLLSRPSEETPRTKTERLHRMASQRTEIRNTFTVALLSLGMLLLVSVFVRITTAGP